jgi:cell division protein FtsN
MSRRRKQDINSDEIETDKDRKAYRIELSRKQLFGGSLCLLVVLCWMFVFGVYIGRGIPLTDSRDIPWKSQLLRFLGLDKEAQPVTGGSVAQTWDDPKKMLESLSYYEELTQKEKNESPSPKDEAGKSPAGSKNTKNQTTDRKTEPSAVVAPAADKTASSGPQQQAPVQKPPDELVVPNSTAEHFTLLVSSVREMENAQRLLEQLRTKRYSPRIETIDLSGSGRWNRILIGSFKSREEAMRFAVEFNRKEHMEGLVIREGD